MSDLMSLLSLGSAGISAQNAGVSIASNNVANVNTKGYSRQRVDLNSLPGQPGGVRAYDPQRMQNNLLAGRMRTAGGSLAMSKAFAEALTDVESRLNSGTSVAQQIGTMFAKFSAAAATPTDSAARDAAVDATRNLVEGIRHRADELESARAEVNQRIRDNVAEANALAQRLAETNLAIAKTNDPAMRDERDRVATALGELTGGKARVDRDGQMRFVLDGGAVLVDGKRASKLEAGADAAGDTTVGVVDGSSRRDVTKAIGGGAIGADLGFRDETLTGAQNDLDQLAYDLTTSANGVHSANAGLDGTTGRNLFGALGGVAGAAKAMSLDPDVDADSDNLALGAPGGGPGDNQGALAMFALASQKVAGGGTKTLTNAALDVVGKVATAASNANADVKRDTLFSNHLEGLRDSLAGVDLEEELTNLARFEHASTAMTKFVATVDDMLGNLIDRL